jgi:inosine-uridine nucleoside N-ribohydrolase
MVRVWIDTDIGDDIDDAVALWCAARHPEIELVGISTVFGHVEARAWLARELLTRLGLGSVPVLPGAVMPLGGENPNRELASYMRLAPEIPYPAPEQDRARVDAIAGAMRSVGEPFHMLTIGAITNAARLLTDHPQVAHQWQSVTCMAGRLEGDAEWNVRCDPVAAKLVVDRLAPRMVGLEASSYTLPRAEVETLLDPGQPAAAFLLDCYRAYRADAHWVEREDAPLTLFDPITLLSLAHPQAFDFQSVRVMVERNGRLRLTDDGGQVEYAMSSKWEALRPVIEGLLERT